MTDTWWEEAKKRLAECIEKQKARDERILRGWEQFKQMNPKLDKISSKSLHLKFDKLINENFKYYIELGVSIKGGSMMKKIKSFLIFLCSICGVLPMPRKLYKDIKE